MTLAARGEVHFLLCNFSTFFGPDEKSVTKKFPVLSKLKEARMVPIVEC